MIREADFYQAAYEASKPYILNIGKQLEDRHGFRALEESHVAIHHPFTVSPSSPPLLLSLIATPSTGRTHVIQLPAQLSTLFNENSTDVTPRLRLTAHPRLMTLSTVLTPMTCHITECTLAVEPLNDLISFLQCLLPSSTALTLTATTSIVAHPTFRNDMETIARSDADARAPNSTESGTLDEIPRAHRRAANGKQDGNAAEMNVISRIDAWRLTSRTDEDSGGAVVVASSSAPLEEEAEGKLIEIEVCVEIEDVSSRMSTPNPQWLNKNEDMLRETVGCSYFRRLRELAIAE